MTVQPREIQRYVRPDGRIPFDEWFYSLRNAKAKIILSTWLKALGLKLTVTVSEEAEDMSKNSASSSELTV